MIEFLNYADTSLFLWLNSFHNPFFDQVMWIVSGKLTWIPVYAAMLIYIIYRYRKTCWLPLLGVALVILLSDQIASGLIKPLTERLRPSHEPSLAGMVHIVNGYTGGKYGFVSSHASNMFGLAVFMLLLVRRKWFTITILLWASLIAYSRIYLGVHYPGDVIGGALVGCTSAVFAYWIVSWGLEKRKRKRKNI